MLNRVVQILDRFIDRVGLHQQEFSLANQFQCPIHCILPSLHFVNLFHALAAVHALLEQGHDFARLTPSKVLVFVENDSIEVVCQDFTLANHVGVSPITSCRIDHRTAWVRELVQSFGNCQKRGLVVTVVHNYCRSMNLHEIKTARNFVHV